MGAGATDTRIKVCELCGAEALFHCPADSAFLCRSCDSKVHASNFLVARHVRQIVCRSCKSVTGNSISGPVSTGLRGKCLRCKSCSSLFSSSSSSSFSSDCVSSCVVSSTDAGENRRKRRKNSVGRNRRLTEGRIHGEAEGIFVNWCEKLGLKGNSRNAVVSSASWALAVCLERLTPLLPFRVRLAASFWFGFRVSGDRSEMVTWQNLRRLEEVSGVPSKTVLAVETRLARALRLRLRRWRLDMEEGWAESDGA